MAKTKSDLIIKFGGRLDSLFIEHKGEVILNYHNDSTADEEHSEEYLRNQGKLGLASSFAKAVYSIPVLRQVWNRSYFKKSVKTRYKVAANMRRNPGKAKAFNKIVSANRRLLTEDHPTENNIIVPRSDTEIIIQKMIINREGINLSILPKQVFFEIEEKEFELSAAGILCVYNPKGKIKKRFELLPKWILLSDIECSEWDNIIIPFEREEEEIVRRYKNSIFYFTVVCSTKFGRVLKWTNTYRTKMTNRSKPVQRRKKL